MAEEGKVAQAVGTPVKPRRRRRKIILITLGAVLLAVVLLVALAPMLAGAFVPGRIDLKTDGRTTGAVEISGASFSWFGPQRISDIRVVDERGQLVAEAKVESSAGLMGAALGAMGMGSLDLGETHVSARANIVRGVDGKTNIERVFPPSTAPAGTPAPSGGGGGLPKDLAARVVVDSLELTFVDEAAVAKGSEASAVAVRNVKADATFRVGSPISANFAAEAFYGKDGSSITTPGGRVALKAVVDGVTDASGRLTPDSAKIDATLDGDFAVALADVLAGMEHKLVGALGDRLTLKASVKGTGQDADADFKVASAALSVDAGLKYAKAGNEAWLTATRPAVVRADTKNMLPLIPGAEAMEAQGAAKVEKLPVVSVSVDQLKLRMPTGGAGLDLRGSAIGAKVDVGETLAKVRVPGPGGAPGTMKDCRVAPLTLTLAAPDLAQGVTLKGQTGATLGGESAGAVTIDLAASGLLDDKGAPRTMPAKAEGAVLVQGVATAIAQPFVTAAGLDLAQDVGPKVDVELRAKTREAAAGAGGTAGAAGAIPPTDLSLRVASANVNATGKVALDAGVIRGPGTAFELTVGSAGPLAGRLLKDAGVVITSGAGAKVEVKDLTLDTGRLGGPEAGPGAGKSDLRGVSAVIAVSTTETAGSAVLVPGEPAHPFTAAPLVATVDASDLAKGISVKAEGSATLDGKPAGTLYLALRAAGLLDEHGGPLGLPRSVVGSGGIEGINTAALQPMVKSVGLDLPKDIGPYAAVRFKATADGAAAGAGGIPPTRLGLEIVSDQVTAQADLIADENSIRATGEGFRLTAKSAGAIASRFVKPDTGVTMAPGGWVTVTASGISVPLDKATRKPLLDKAGATVAVKSGAFVFGIRPTGGEGGAQQQVQVGPLDATTSIAPGAAPKVRVNSPLTVDGSAGSLAAEMDLVGLLAPDGAGGLKVDPMAARPVGRVEIKNLPTGLARLAPRPAPPAAKPGEPAPAPGLDIGRLLSEALGPTASVTAVSAKGRGDALDLTIGLTAERATVTASASVGSAALDLKKVDASATITPALAAAVFDGVMPPGDPKPRLPGPAQFIASVDPVKIPLGAGFKPDFAKAGTISARARLEGRLLVEGLQAKGAEGQPARDLGPVGIENLDIVAKAPLTGLAPGGAPTHAEAVIKGRVLGGPTEKLAELQVRADADLAGGGLAKPAVVQAYVSEINTRRLDTLAGKPGLISGAIGDSAVLDATATVELPGPVAAAGKAPAAPAVAPAFQKITLKAGLNAPRLQTTKPLQATVVPDKLTLDQPLGVTWLGDPAFLNAMLESPPGADGKKPEQAAKITAPVEVSLSLTSLVLAMGPGNGPLKPGVFATGGRVDIPVVQMVVKDGTPVEFDNLRMGFVGGQAPGVIGFDVRTEGVEGAQSLTSGSSVLVKGGLYEIADASGVPTADKAYVTADGDVINIPTAFIDTLAKQNGVLVEAIGPVVTLKASAQAVNKNQGRLAADVTSTRAKANVSGSMQAGVFVADAPVVATLNEITPKLGGMLVKGLPLVGTFYKKPEDGPTRLTITGLRAPVDGDLSKLNGDAVLDVGTARFNTSNVFSTLLKFTGQKDAGQVGQRMEPLHVAMNNGVLSYPRYKLPLGEFSVETEGSVNLAAQTIDVVTYIPLGALTDEAAGALNSGLGQLLSGTPIIGQMSQVPFRTSGSLANPGTKPDMELLVKNLGGSLRPGKIVEDVLGDLFNKQPK